MKVVGPRADSHIHHGARFPAVFRLGIFLKVEFLYGVDGQDRGPIGDEARGTGHRAGIIETGVDNALHHPRRFIGANVIGALGPRSTARLDHHARAQRQQVLVVTSIQGQVLNLRVVQCAAQSGIGGLHQWDGLGDRDALGLLAGLHGNVNPNLLAHLEHHVLALHPLEPIGLNAHRIGARNQRGSVILPCIIST